MRQIAELLCWQGLNPLFPLFEGLGKKTQLASDLPALWHSVTTTAQERKEMLGLLVKQVALSPVESPTRQTRIAILWHTGATTSLILKRPTTREKLSTPSEAIEAIRELTAGRTYAEIAEQLNQRGFLTGKGRKFTPSAVNWICSFVSD